MGSVKKLSVLNKATEKKRGYGYFWFSDDYSVFDWGKMPNTIPQKGEALAMMAGFAFEELKKEYPKIMTHYKGMANGNGWIESVKKLTSASDVMYVDLVNVIKPVFNNGCYDYASIQRIIKALYLLPFEAIYRNYLPEGSSIFKRLKSGEIHYHDLGLKEYPKAGQKLPKPYFELTTKLESTDRPLTWEEARTISGLSISEMNGVKVILGHINNVITKIASRADLKNEDGKIELALDKDRRLMVVDVFGTPDECRFTYQGVSVGKQMLRNYYKNTDWFDGVVNAKKRAKKEGIEDWQSLCLVKPEAAPKELVTLVSNAYKAMTNAILQKEIFGNTPTLLDITKEYKSNWW